MDVRNDAASARYVATIDGAEAGEAFYERNGNEVTFTHTEVSDAFGGLGVGGALAKRALDDARAAGATVLPQCPFIAHYIARHTDYLALVPTQLHDQVKRA